MEGTKAELVGDAVEVEAAVDAAAAEAAVDAAAAEAAVDAAAAAEAEVDVADAGYVSCVRTAVAILHCRSAVTGGLVVGGGDGCVGAAVDEELWLTRLLTD